MLPERERNELGEKLGEAMRLLIEVIAQLDQASPEDVCEQIVATYVAARIIREAE